MASNMTKTSVFLVPSDIRSQQLKARLEAIGVYDVMSGFFLQLLAQRGRQGDISAILFDSELMSTEAFLKIKEAAEVFKDTPSPSPRSRTFGTVLPKVSGDKKLSYLAKRMPPGSSRGDSL